MLKKRKKNKRNELLALIPFLRERILDPGCGSASLWDSVQKDSLEVVGVERDKGLCEQAEKRLKKVFCEDVESFKPPYPEGYFDAILCADILEHLIDPVKFLREYKPYLNDEGIIVASMPNIRYYKVISQLVFRGTWDYMESGILDRTHLRFFTLVNMRELFAEAGYDVLEVKRNIVASRWMKVFNFVLLGLLKDFMTYQYYIKVGKSKTSSGPFLRKRTIQHF